MPEARQQPDDSNIAELLCKAALVASQRDIDILDVAEKADKLIASGTCCIDEVREIIGFDKLNTEFSMKHFITKNYDTAENRLIGDEQNNKGGE